MNNIFAQASTNAQRLEVIGKHYARLEGQMIFFPIEKEGIDFGYKISDDDLILRLKDQGLQTSESDIKRMLISDQIQEVNLIDILFDKMPIWDKRDRFSEMYKALNIDGDSSINKPLMLKWFLIAYTLAFFRTDNKIKSKRFPRVVLILHSNERSFGKTGFFRRILFDGFISDINPKLDLDLYAEQNGKLTEDKLELNSYLAYGLGINIDDIDNTLTDKANQGELRSKTTATSVTNRVMYKSRTQRIPRRASYVGTTNLKSILRDPDETRYLVFTCFKKIDFTALDEKDFALQLWSQIREIAQSYDGDIKFTNIEQDQIIKIGQEYIYKYPHELALESLFVYEPKGTMKFKDIRNRLFEEGHNISEKLLSQALERIATINNNIKRKVDGYWYYNFREKTKEEKEGATRETFVSAGDGLPF